MLLDLVRFLFIFKEVEVNVVRCFSNSEEEAKKKIYNVSCERYFGFGCEIDEETSNKLEGYVCLSLFVHFISFFLLS